MFFLKQVIVVSKVEINKIIIIIDFKNTSYSINCRYISSYLTSTLNINFLFCCYILISRCINLLYRFFII